MGKEREECDSAMLWKTTNSPVCVKGALCERWRQKMRQKRQARVRPQRLGYLILKHLEVILKVKV